MFRQFCGKFFVVQEQKSNIFQINSILIKSVKTKMKGKCLC